MSPDGNLFGREALKALLQAAIQGDGCIGDRARSVLQKVAAFENGADPVDDQTLLLLQWHGRAPLWKASNKN